jgi:hypothetical protein
MTVVSMYTRLVIQSGAGLCFVWLPELRHTDSFRVVLDNANVLFSWGRESSFNVVSTVFTLEIFQPCKTQ